MPFSASPTPPPSRLTFCSKLFGICISVTFALHLFGRRPQNTWSEAELGIVLRACEGVATLVFVGSLDEPVSILPMLACMRPQRLYMVSEMSHPQLDLTMPFFQNISHLLADIDTGPGSLVHGWPLLRNLSRLPALTHLALDQHTPPRVRMCTGHPRVYLERTRTRTPLYPTAAGVRVYTAP